MALTLCRGIRARYPDWKYLIDGDGGDENLKDYPIEENPELTIRSVVNNVMLYQEGWGVDSIKHSLTYSGGLSRGYALLIALLAASAWFAFSSAFLWGQTLASSGRALWVAHLLYGGILSLRLPGGFGGGRLP
jgi:hypothetical protein